jgi:hypothetical protein
LHTACLPGFVSFEFQVFSIRDAAANNLKRLAEEFGPEWAMQHIIPQVIYLLSQHLIFVNVTDAN